MKRNNPITGKPFKRGDIREEDGARFYRYMKRLSAEGYFSEDWKTPKAFEVAVEKQSVSAQIRKEENKRLVEKGSLQRRLNPKTGKEFKVGEVRDEDGYIFVEYQLTNKKYERYQGELWSSPTAYHRSRVQNTLEQIRIRVRRKKLDINIDIDYLIEIFPDDGICPVTGVKMEWGGNRQTSPSVDRIYPDKGYVRGNVRWILMHANFLKTDYNLEMLEKVYFDMKKIMNK